MKMPTSLDPHGDGKWDRRDRRTRRTGIKLIILINYSGGNSYLQFRKFAIPRYRIIILRKRASSRAHSEYSIYYCVCVCLI